MQCVLSIVIIPYLSSCKCEVVLLDFHLNLNMQLGETTILWVHWGIIMDKEDLECWIFGLQMLFSFHSLLPWLTDNHIHIVEVLLCFQGRGHGDSQKKYLHMMENSLIYPQILSSFFLD